MSQRYPEPFRRDVARDAFYGNAKIAAARHGVTADSAGRWRLRYFGKTQGTELATFRRLLRDHGPMGANAMLPLYEVETGEVVSVAALSTKLSNEHRRGRLDREKIAHRWVYRIKAH